MTSLVILNYNSANLVKKLVEKTSGFNIISKIIIVDNNSTDNSLEDLCDIQNEKVVIIENNINSGYARGNNIGIKYSIEKLGCDTVIIANPDVEFSETTVQKCIEKLYSSSDYAITVPKINNINCSGKIAWKLPNFGYDLLSLFYITNKIAEKIIDYKVSDLNKDEMEVDVIPGSLIIAKSSALVDIDFFDEGTFLYCEERILSYKIKERNYKILLLNNESYTHEHGSTIKKEISNKVKQYKILNNSKRHYLVNYLKINKIKLKVFDLLCRLSIIEKYVIELLTSF